MNPRRAIALVLTSATLVLGAVACDTVTAPEGAAFEDIPARDTSGFIIPMQPLQPR